MIRAWALLTERDSRCRWARCRDPISVTGLPSGNAGLPACEPAGTRVGTDALGAGAPGVPAAADFEGVGRTAMNSIVLSQPRGGNRAATRSYDVPPGAA